MIKLVGAETAGGVGSGVDSVASTSVDSLSVLGWSWDIVRVCEFTGLTLSSNF